MAKRHPSPCIDVCKFAGPNGWCLGCGRTLKECNKWQAMKPYARNALERDLQRRMSKMAAGRSKD